MKIVVMALLSLAITTTAYAGSYGFTNQNPQPGKNNPSASSEASAAQYSGLAPAAGRKSTDQACKKDVKHACAAAKASKN